jgi:hypothetical protein
MASYHRPHPTAQMHVGPVHVPRLVRQRELHHTDGIVHLADVAGRNVLQRPSP